MLVRIWQNNVHFAKKIAIFAKHEKIKFYRPTTFFTFLRTVFHVIEVMKHVAKYLQIIASLAKKVVTYSIMCPLVKEFSRRFAIL